MKNVRYIEIDEMLMQCIRSAWNDIQRNKVVCSSDLYQNDQYCGGFEGDVDDMENGEFAFGRYDGKVESCWISIPYKSMGDIISGKIKSVKAYDPE